MVWDDETKNEILKLFNDGLSATAVAQQIGKGISRNAVLGIVDRARCAGVVLRERQPARGRIFVLETPKTRTRPKLPSLPAADLTAPAARLKDDGSRVGTLDLREKDCRWPHGEVGTDGFHYCANEKRAGSPYCPYHTARAWRRPGTAAA